MGVGGWEAWVLGTQERVLICSGSDMRGSSKLCPKYAKEYGQRGSQYVVASKEGKSNPVQP